MKKYFLYTQERFPLVPALILTASLYYCGYSFGSLFSTGGGAKAVDCIVGGLVLFLATFHLRIFDEHKDYDKDVLAHPERMLSKGIITLPELRRLLVVLIVFEALMSIYLGVVQVALWIAILVYTYLMLREFFISEALNRNMGAYLISHQLLLPLMLLFPFMQASPSSLSSLRGGPVTTLVFFTCGMLAYMTFEIARKTWPKEKEHEHADSYTKIWGNAGAVATGQLVALTASAGFIFLFLSLGGSTVSVLVQAALFAVFLGAGAMFLKSPTMKSSKLLENTGALFMLATYLNAAICFTLISRG